MEDGSREEAQPTRHEEGALRRGHRRWSIRARESQQPGFGENRTSRNRFHEAMCISRPIRVSNLRGADALGIHRERPVVHRERRSGAEALALEHRAGGHRGCRDTHRRTAQKLVRSDPSCPGGVSRGLHRDLGFLAVLTFNINGERSRKRSPVSHWRCRLRKARIRRLCSRPVHPRSG